MLKDDAISFYGSQAEYARALGRAPSTICEYGTVLPLEAALLTEKMTKGRRRVDFTLYPADKLPPSLVPRQ
jgi:hypothetical protein